MPVAAIATRAMAAKDSNGQFSFLAFRLR